MKTAVKTVLSTKNNCYINVKMLFENVRVCVRIRLYPPFPITQQIAHFPRSHYNTEYTTVLIMKKNITLSLMSLNHLSLYFAFQAEV